ncbi:DoxX family membrane protein [Octadecabacter sp. R77987]|uniref:DoxX family membrane protein n=1 Tax=Octadecabacter sp. R77987 TaxID=3093874 RepID=UPI00366C56E1
MSQLITTYRGLLARLDRTAPVVLPTLARLVFSAVTLVYFWRSAVSKLGEGFWGFLSPSSGGYVQIFPKAMEAASYNTGELGVFHWAVVVAGTWAEFILPALILLGLLTRPAALGMIGFITVQSLTDLYGHGGIEHAATLGAWFDRLPDGVIMDQRAFWVLALLVLVFKGAGPLSLDRFFRNAP